MKPNAEIINKWFVSFKELTTIITFNYTCTNEIVHHFVSFGTGKVFYSYACIGVWRVKLKNK